MNSVKKRVAANRLKTKRGISNWRWLDLHPTNPVAKFLYEDFIKKYRQSNPSVNFNLTRDIGTFAMHLTSLPLETYPSIRSLANTLSRLAILCNEYNSIRGDVVVHSAKFRLIKNNTKRMIQQHRRELAANSELNPANCDCSSM